MGGLWMQTATSEGVAAVAGEQECVLKIESDIAETTVCECQTAQGQLHLGMIGCLELNRTSDSKIPANGIGSV
jgi:hypothetical protein